MLDSRMNNSKIFLVDQPHLRKLAEGLLHLKKFAKHLNGPQELSLGGPFDVWVGTQTKRIREMYSKLKYRKDHAYFSRRT